MDKILLQKWIHYTWLSDFFADFAKWEKTTHALSPLLGDTWARQARGRAELQQEYDELFKGCHADIYIPLWASACMGRGDILFDETTLDVIKFYYRHGYRPVNMDGNPPDFIGQQLRFLAYLSAASLPQTEEEFAGRFLADTVAEIAKGLRQHAKSSLFADILNILLKITSGDFDTQWDQSQLTFAENFLKMSHDGRVYRDGAAEPIPLGEKTLVKTAGRNNCGGKCPLRAAVQEGCVLYINAGDEKNFPHIRPCLRGRSYRQNYLSGKRLRYPMKRIGERGEGRFKRISWEEAADLAAGEIERIGKTYGAASRYVNYGWGVSAVLRPDAFVMRLLNLDGGFLGHYNTYSFACTFYTTPFIYGDLLSGNGIADVLNTKLLVLWGHNPAETIFGSERNYYLTKAKEKGVRIIVIDPRFSDTAATLADEWIGIRPSTDGALADAMAYVIWSQGLYNKEFMDKYCLGFDEEHLPAEAAPGSSYATYLFGKNDGVAKTPKWAQAITGIPAETIERLACDYATSKPACLLPGYGVQRIGNGEQTVRGIAMLASLTGNIGIPGGGAGGFGGVVERARPVFPMPPNPVPAKIPCFLWTKAVEDGKGMNKIDDALEGAEKLDADIKMIVSFASNTLVNQHSDINDTVRILRDTNKVEFILSSDVFMTASARFADLLLPAASLLESENIAGSWGYGSYLLFGNKVIDPFFGCRFEHGFIRDVAGRMGYLEGFDEGHENCSQWLKSCYDNVRAQEPGLPEYEVFKNNGGFKFSGDAPYIAYKKQIEAPASHPFATPSGKIEIFSQRLDALGKAQGKESEIPAIPKYVPCAEGPGDPLAEKYPLQLIGWHTKRSTHSVHYACDWMEEAEPHRLWINPHDAGERGITCGDTVEVFNGRGRLRVKASVTGRIVRGVVAMPQGAWYSPDKNGVDTAGSINVLTAFRPTPLAKGNPQHTNLVEVVKG